MESSKGRNAQSGEFSERVVAINRVSKVVKGGKRFNFSALVIIGDGQKYVGVGMGKAREIPEAVRKGIEHAKKSLVEIRKVGETLPHESIGDFGAAKVLIRPAAPGTGVIAGAVVRAIMELGGVKDVLTKVLGRTSNSINVARATMEAIKLLRTREEITKLRGRLDPKAATEESKEVEA